MEKLLERLEKRVRGALLRIDELGQENETLKLRVDELTTENVRLSTELQDKGSELGDLEELRSQLEDSQARQELVRLRLNDIIAELDEALGIEDEPEVDSDFDDGEAEQITSADEPENEAQQTPDSPSEPPDDDSVSVAPPQIQPITEVEWGADSPDPVEPAAEDSEAAEQTELARHEEDSATESIEDEAQDDPPPELKDEANPLGLFGGVLDRKTDTDAD